jgi:asparagine synthase (glutamine-hydrolysing)|tara:strand:+ start:614 stop:1828 length:1215 start_codon:yes stop_codon:yes gene_type:complete
MLNQNLNKNSIRNLLTIRYDPSERSLIPKASYKNFNGVNTDADGLKTKKLLKNAFLKQIKEPRKPLAISLSSGIDSTLCLSLLRDTFPNSELIGICGVFENGFDESKQASKIAKKFDAKFKTVKMPSIYQTMPKLISITKKPKWNAYTHIIAQEAKKFSDYNVVGDGADEVFGGYNFRYNKFLSLVKPTSSPLDKIQAYLSCHNRDWVPDQKKLFGKNIEFKWDSIYKYFKPYFSNTLHSLQQVMLADFNGKLMFDFIPTSKFVSSHYALNGVSPFLDSDVIKFGLSINPQEKYDDKTQKGKLILRKIASSMNIKHIDEKRGFSPELWFDWKKQGKKIFDKYIFSKDCEIVKNKLINEKWISTAFEYVENDGSILYLNRLTSVLALEIWYKIFISKEMNVNEKL